MRSLLAMAMAVWDGGGKGWAVGALLVDDGYIAGSALIMAGWGLSSVFIEFYD